MKYLLVGVGGMLGSIARYAAGILITNFSASTKFPLPTFIVNVLGCFLIGVAAVQIEKLSSLNEEARLLLITGVLGGFTTFSAFSSETLGLLRSGETLLAFLYSCLSVILGIAAVQIGMRLAH